MRRAALLAGLLFLSAFVGAQESQKQEAQPTPAEARQTGWSTAAGPETGANPATTPDSTYPPRPRDIDILTGKADRESRAQSESGYPYVYMYGPGGTGYSWQGGWRRRGVPFSAFGFGRLGGHRGRVFTVPRGRFFPRF